ncbi:MAG: 4-alpha-glucanotransferase [Rhodospirillaceae bacterium]
MSDAEIAELARLAGIQNQYWDVEGRVHHTSTDTQRALLAAMGFAPEEARVSIERLRAAERALPPVLVKRTPIRELHLPLEGPFSWHLHLENGEVMEGRAERRIHFAHDLPLGYHALTIGEEKSTLIVAPETGYAPEWLKRGEKAWGVACHLYTVSSERNWGIGDFADLKELLRMTAAEGGQVVAVNPFHALSLRDPDQASPYWPSSRTFLNPLYISLGDPPADAPVSGALVDYPKVAKLKLEALRNTAVRAAKDPDLDVFIADGGDALADFCVFSALSDHLPGPWPSWPREFRDPASPAVRRWAAGHQSEVRIHAALQWLAAMQLAEAVSGTSAVVMRDLAVGVSPEGAEAWHRQGLYPQGARFGAPPDPLGPDGQDWGLPPPDPHVLRALAYEPLVRTWRANMRHAGALRIDHAMALERLFWIPPGGTAADGAYVSYPVDDLFAVLALESVRAKCLLVGEDLGTVPDGFRERMERDNMLSTRLFYFERHRNGYFKRPDTYPARSVAQATTHDLPTLAGYWTGTDMRIRLSLKPGVDDEAMERARAEERALIVGALKDQNLLDDRPLTDIAVEEIVAAVHAFLGLSGSQLVLLNLSDVIAMTTQLNVPGTTDEYPNWRARLAQSLETIRAESAWPAAAAVMQRTRGRTTASAA